MSSCLDSSMDLPVLYTDLNVLNLAWEKSPIGCMIWRWDEFRADFKLLMANPASQEMTQHRWALGEWLREKAPGHDQFNTTLGMSLADWYRKALGSQKELKATFYFDDADGSLTGHWENSCTPINSTDIYMMFRSVSAEVRDQQRLRDAASKDGLTGKYNQEHFRYLVTEILKLDEPVAVLFIDIDRFKPVNDCYGHAVGDEFLVELSDRIQLALRDVDILARYGGDEFVCLLRNVERHEQAAMIAERVSRAIAAPWQCDGITLTVRASIGIAMRSPSVNTCEALFRESDRAMYCCKERHGCPFCFASEDDHIAAISAVQIIADFREALKADDQLILHYQEIRRLDAAILDPQDYPVAGYEALIRWQHPTRGLLYPNVFLGYVEQAGLMAELTRWVIREATRAKKQLPEHIYLAVNISPLLDADEMSAIAQTICPSISVEVTESALNEATISPLLEMRSRGVGLLLDDMGTAHSNLKRTLSLPWDGIKIDRSFKYSAILPEMVGIIQKCGSRAIIEGIEAGDEELLERCVDLGIEYGQGWLWDRGGPLPRY